jgi:hypothetical protein
MICDFCSSYGVQTVSVKENNKQVEVCFECIEGESNAEMPRV